MNIFDDKFAIILKSICLAFVILCLSACEESRYDRAFDQLMLHEGGYVNHPDDPGGETKYGICKKYNPEVDIKNITLEYAKNYYYKNFWTSMYDKIRHPKVAVKLFDVSVNVGKKRMRELVNATLMDSLCYPDERLIIELNRVVDAYENHNDICSWEKFVVTQINSMDQELFLNMFKNNLMNYYCSLFYNNKSLITFRKGWIKRAMKG